MSLSHLIARPPKFRCLADIWHRVRVMRAWVVREHGAPESISLEEVADPPGAPDKALIAVRATAVNFADSLSIEGTYQEKPELPFIPGREVAGEVVDAPEGSGFAAGDRVAALVLGDGLVQGGYAEMTQADPSLVSRIPDSMPFEEAAGFFGTYQTAWFGLHRRGQLQEGETALIHAGAGGVGSAAIQLAKAAGAQVIATAGGTDKVAVCRQLGADLAIDYSSEDFVAAVKEFTGGRGADVIYDPVGGEVFEKSTKCIAFEGRLVVVGFAGGDIPTLRANHVMVKNYAVVGLYFGSYFQKMPELVEQSKDELLALYEKGLIRPHVSRTAPLDEMVSELQAVCSRKTTGKVVLTI
jgi:NADPH2:quinone reductase